MKDYYSNKEKWNSVFRCIKSYGDTLNPAHLRTLKGVLNERLICTTSNNFKHINQEYDVFDVSANWRLELKGMNGCLYTKKNGLRENTLNIKIKNVQGDKKSKLDPDKMFDDVVSNFDYLLVIDTKNEHTYSAAMISSQDLRLFADYSATDDGCKVKIPLSKMQILCEPCDLNINMTTSELKHHEKIVWDTIADLLIGLNPEKKEVEYHPDQTMFSFMYEAV